MTVSRTFCDLLWKIALFFTWQTTIVCYHFVRKSLKLISIKNASHFFNEGTCRTYGNPGQTTRWNDERTGTHSSYWFLSPTTSQAIMCYAMSFSVMLCDNMLSYVMSCDVMLCYVMLCYVMWCYVMLCYVMWCYVMLCYVMLCYVMLCYVMLCYVMLFWALIILSDTWHGRM